MTKSIEKKLLIQDIQDRLTALEKENETIKQILATTLVILSDGYTAEILEVFEDILPEAKFKTWDALIEENTEY